MKVKYIGQADIRLWSGQELLVTSKTFKAEARVIPCTGDQVIELCTSRPEQWEPGDEEAKKALKAPAAPAVEVENE